MSILFAMALAATHAAQAVPAVPVDHARHQQHAKHLAEMQKHADQCKDMMLKMHQGMGGHGAVAPAKPSGEHQQGHGSHHR